MTTYQDISELFKKLIIFYLNGNLSAAEVAYLLENTFGFISSNKYISLPNQFVEEFEDLDIPYFSPIPENVDEKFGIYGVEEFKLRILKFLDFLNN